MNPNGFEDDLTAAVNALPELYQPLYGQASNIARGPARNCEDRLESVIAAISAHAVRPLKILDIGCAQGYFSLGLCDQIPGISTLGVDYLQENISVCELLAKKLGYKASFRCAPITKNNFLELMDAQFQVTLFLNVLHHICTQLGWQETRDILLATANSCDFALIELSLSRENLGWVKNQPKDHEWLDSFKFVKKIGDYPTHVSAENRALYFCSNKYFYAAGKLFSFSSYLDKSHELAISAQELGRHYYISPSMVAKRFDFSGPHRKINYLELVREMNYLETTQSPKVFASEINRNEGLLVRGKIVGSLLSDTWEACNLTATKTIYKNLLAILIDLQNEAFYHHDLRPWNIIIKADNTIELIDFGSITSRKKRHCFEDAIFLLHWLITKEWEDYAEPATLLDASCCWQQATMIYLQATSTNELSFERMLAIANSDIYPISGSSAISNVIQFHIDAISSNARRLALLARKNAHLYASAISADAYVKSLTSELHKIQSVISAERDAWAVERSEAKKQIDALTQWATSADVYAKSLRDELENFRSTVEIESTETRNQTSGWAQLAASADAYGKSLLKALEGLKSS